LSQFSLNLYFSQCSIKYIFKSNFWYKINMNELIDIYHLLLLCMWTPICMHKYTWTHTHAQTHTPTGVHTHTHTHRHTHTSTHVQYAYDVNYRCHNTCLYTYTYVNARATRLYTVQCTRQLGVYTVQCTRLYTVQCTLSS